MDIGTRVAIQLVDDLPKDSKKYLTAFMQSYAGLAGWKIDGIRFHRRFIEFSVAPERRSIARETARRGERGR